MALGMLVVGDGATVLLQSVAESIESRCRAVTSAGGWARADQGAGLNRNARLKFS